MINIDIRNIAIIANELVSRSIPLASIYVLLTLNARRRVTKKGQV